MPVVDERDCEERTTVGELTKWGEWSTCSETCGEGFQTRIKTCFGWRQGSSRLVCYGSVTDTTKCKKGPCPGNEISQNCGEVKCSIVDILLCRYCHTLPNFL